MRTLDLTMEMPGDEHVNVVRAYTSEERLVVRPAERESVEERLQRLTDTSAIDIERYQQAAAERPDMGEHFEFLIAASSNSLDAWRQYYEHEAVSV